MAPVQQTLRITGLPPATTTDEVKRHFRVHVKDKERPSVVAVGPICKEPDADTNETTVSFSSIDAANRALDLDRDARMLTASQGGAAMVSVDKRFRGMTTLERLVNPDTCQPDIE